MNADDAFSFEFIDPNNGYIELDVIYQITFPVVGISLHTEAIKE